MDALFPSQWLETHVCQDNRDLLDGLNQLRVRALEILDRCRQAVQRRLKQLGPPLGPAHLVGRGIEEMRHAPGIVLVTFSERPDLIAEGRHELQKLLPFRRWKVRCFLDPRFDSPNSLFRHPTTSNLAVTTSMRGGGGENRLREPVFPLTSAFLMAKTSWINRNDRKRKTVEKYAALRAELKTKKDYIGLSQLPRDASPTRVVNRCQVTGRRRAFIRRFKVSRLTFRELASAGLIPGVTKSSW